MFDFILEILIFNRNSIADNLKSLPLYLKKEKANVAPPGRIRPREADNFDRHQSGGNAETGAGRT